jgi:23S rRNA pseudouridine1911/1915/1917 synthase
LIAIIHEDTDLLVVHKPADLVCHPTKGDEYSSLVSRARIYLANSSANDMAREASASGPALAPHLIHRLDRETSGLVMIAKNPVAARELGKVWETRAVRKEYLAIVHGHVTADRGIIEAPLGRDETSRVAIQDCVRADGQPARTDFEVEKRFFAAEGAGAAAPCSLLRLHPLTGRKHQIRIHLAHLGHPIVGDKIYGGDPDLYLALVEHRLTEAQRTRLMLAQHALHASRLRFAWQGREYDFTTPPERAFAEFISAGSPI